MAEIEAFSELPKGIGANKDDIRSLTFNLVDGTNITGFDEVSEFLINSTTIKLNVLSGTRSSLPLGSGARTLSSLGFIIRESMDNSKHSVQTQIPLRRTIVGTDEPDVEVPPLLTDGVGERVRSIHWTGHYIPDPTLVFAPGMHDMRSFF